MSTYSRCFRGDFTSLSEEQKLRSVLKTMDNMMLEVSNNKYAFRRDYCISRVGILRDRTGKGSTVTYAEVA